MSRPTITPAMKVGELLADYPELEARLVALAPAFEKLRNPVLRRTVAKVATLEQAARIAGITPASLVAALRDEREDVEPARAPQQGSPAPARASAAAGAEKARSAKSAELATMTIDLDARLEEGIHPLREVLDALEGLEPGASLELVASFRPEPLFERLEGERLRIEESPAPGGRTRWSVTPEGRG